MAKVFIFVPAFGRLISASTFESTHALAGAFLQKGIPYTVSTCSWPGIDELRSMVLSYWYDVHRDSTHLLFVDADMGFHPQMVLDMLTFGEPMVGAIYPKKAYPIEWAGSGLALPDYRPGFIEADGLGMGCFLIRRDAVDAMIEKFPELIKPHMMIPEMKFAGATRTLNFFRKMETEQGDVSEDISFCRRYRETGGKIWASIAYDITHEGPHAYTGNFTKSREAEAKKKAEEDGKAAA